MHKWSIEPFVVKSLLSIFVNEPKPKETIMGSTNATQDQSMCGKDNEIDILSCAYIVGVGIEEVKKSFKQSRIKENRTWWLSFYFNSLIL